MVIVITLRNRINFNLSVTNQWFPQDLATKISRWKIHSRKFMNHWAKRRSLWPSLTVWWTEVISLGCFQHKQSFTKRKHQKNRKLEITFFTTETIGTSKVNKSTETVATSSKPVKICSSISKCRWISSLTRSVNLGYTVVTVV